MAALLTTGARAGPEPQASRVPQGPLARLADLPGAPRAEVSPEARTLALLLSHGLPARARLAGRDRRLLPDLVVDPRLRASVGAASWDELVLLALDVAAGVPSARQVRGLPAEARLRDATFAPDGRTLALTQLGRDGLELWLVDVRAARARRLPRVRLQGVFPTPCVWSPDSRALFCRSVPEPAPTLPSEGAEPRVLDAREPAADVLAQGLLASALRAQVLRVERDGRVTPLGQPDAVRRAEPSPDGRHLLVETLRGPFAPERPVTEQARQVEVWDLRGRSAARPVAVVGADPTRARARDFAWRADAPATLVWSETEGGAALTLRLLEAPFDGRARAWATGLRGSLRALAWSRDDLAVAQTEGADGRLQRYRVAPDGSAPARLVSDEPGDDPRRDSGRLALFGGRLLLDGDEAFVLRGPAPDGAPGVERVALASGARLELWPASADELERPVAALDARGARWLTRRESPRAAPSFALRDTRAGLVRELWATPAVVPLPPVAHEVWNYPCGDGAACSADVWRPEQTPPARAALVWLYPEARAGNALAWAPPGPLDARVWALDGHVVLEPALPSPGGLRGAAYVERVVVNARAAVDEAARRGLIDPARVAVAGHSFGASLAALVLARDDSYRCGVALGGAYNRTLTPFGFQGERRTLWQAPHDYLAWSALAQAERLRAPLLLIHGADDPHPATPATQSEQLFAALRGLGAPARLVLLPGEGHTLRSREAVLQALTEMQDWLRACLAPRP